jgi:hypothetical protein
MPKTRTEKNCGKCGKVFWPFVSEVNRGRGKYCSTSCRNPTGPDHYRWKGGAEARRANRSSYQGRYPERVRARRLVEYAIKAGLIKKLPCSICGDPKSEAHHEDYEKPLEVVWLCRRHHREADKRLGFRSGDFVAPCLSRSLQ